MKFICLYFLVLCFSLEGAAQEDIKKNFEDANTFFEQKNYKEAIKVYESIAAQDYQSPELFANLGNAYYHNLELAKAIIQYERGLKYYPGNDRLNNLLELANKKVKTEILEVEDFVLVKFWKGFSNVCSTIIWALLQILFLAALIFGLYQWLIPTDQSKRRKGFIILCISALLFLVAFAAGHAAYTAKFKNNEGIVINQTALKEGPDERSGNLEELSDGMKIQIKDQIGNWYQVQLLNKQVGWLRKGDLELI